jgi:hypothetical protein
MTQRLGLSICNSTKTARQYQLLQAQINDGSPWKVDCCKTARQNSQNAELVQVL